MISDAQAKTLFEASQLADSYGQTDVPTGSGYQWFQELRDDKTGNTGAYGYAA